MRKSIHKQSFSLLCAVMCVCSVTAPCLAVDVATSDSEVSLYIESTNDAQCVLTVQGREASTGVSITDRRGAEWCRIVLETQKKQSSRQITVGSWGAEKDGRNVNLNKSIRAKERTTYRAKVKMTVWLNGKSESKAITTSGGMVWAVLLFNKQGRGENSSYMGITAVNICFVRTGRRT